MKRIIAATPIAAPHWVANTFSDGQQNVMDATRTSERIDGFHRMTGYTIAQTVAMKIDGVHMPRNGAHDLRATPESIYAVY